MSSERCSLGLLQRELEQEIKYTQEELDGLGYEDVIAGGKSTGPARDGEASNVYGAQAYQSSLGEAEGTPSATWDPVPINLNGESPTWDRGGDRLACPHTSIFGCQRLDPPPPPEGVKGL